MPIQIQRRELFLSQHFVNGKWRMEYIEAIGDAFIAQCEAVAAMKKVSGDPEHEMRHRQLQDARNHG